MKNKELNPVMVLLIGFVTFGIANHAFLYMISKRVGRTEQGDTIYPMREMVLNIITFGIYGVIWTYRVAKMLYGNRENAVLCAIISLFPIRCVSMCMLASQM